MANKTIGQLDPAATITGTELIEVEQSGASKRSTVGALGTFTPPSGSGLTATTVAGAISELDARDFQVKMEDFVPVNGGAFGGGGANALNMTFSGGGSAAVFFPTGAQSLLTDAIAAEMTSPGATDSQECVRVFQVLGGIYRRCSGSAKNGGFLVDQIFGFRAAGARADQRAFSGLRGTTADFTPNVDPSTMTNIIGVGKDQADANLKLMHNDGAGAATKIDLGVAFTAIAGKLLQLRIIAPVGGTSMSYDLHNIDDDIHYTGTVTTDLIATDVQVYQGAYVNTGGATAASVAMRAVKFTQFRNYC